MNTRVPSVDAPAKYALVATVSLPPGDTSVTVPPALWYTSIWLSRSTGVAISRSVVSMNTFDPSSEAPTKVARAPPFPPLGPIEWIVVVPLGALVHVHAVVGVGGDQRLGRAEEDLGAVLRVAGVRRRRRAPFPPFGPVREQRRDPARALVDVLHAVGVRGHQGLGRVEEGLRAVVADAHQLGS